MLKLRASAEVAVARSSASASFCGAGLAHLFEVLIQLHGAMKDSDDMNFTGRRLQVDDAIVSPT